MVKQMTRLVMMGMLVAVLAPVAPAQQREDRPTSPEDEFYKIIEIPIPKDQVIEPGAFQTMPDGRLFVATRRGEIYQVDNAYDDPPKYVKFTKWACGLDELLGLAYRDGWLYAMSRGEVTRLKDTTGDGRADVYQNFCDQWGISGNHHEYTFMSKFDKDGNLWAVLCLTGSFTSDAPFRGWFLKITPDGKMLPMGAGIRSPGGITFNEKGEIFYTDNQGPWNGTDAMKQLKLGAFCGHPASLKWWNEARKFNPALPEHPPKEPKSGSRWAVEMKKIPEYMPATALFPYVRTAQSNSGLVCDLSDGKFGPYVHQFFVADQHHANIMRVAMEKVKGYYQSVVVPFRSGFSCGIVPMEQAPDGSIWVGGTNRGWGSVGSKPYSLERLVWTGKVPFELFDMKIQRDGWVVNFTKPLDKAIAGDTKNWKMESYTYIYRAEYGSPEVDPSTPVVKSATVSADGKSVRLVVDGIQMGHIHEFHLDALRSADGKPLLHPVAYYTPWHLPD